jgi:hypothetical protein
LQLHRMLQRCRVKKIVADKTKSDGGLVALFPIQQLVHQFSITVPDTRAVLDEQKRGNNEMRQLIGVIKERVISFVDKSNSRAIEKAEHYIAALDEQLRVCDFVGDSIKTLGSPFAKQRY